MKFQLVTSALFFLMLNNVATADERLIRSTCNQTPYKNLCISSLFSDNRSLNRDKAGLALILVENFSHKTKLANNIVHDRVRSTRDSKVLHALKRCGEMYNAVIIGDVPMAIEALTKGNPKFAEQGARDAAGEARNCEIGFPNGMSPVSGLNREISQLAEVVAAIARQLE